MDKIADSLQGRSLLFLRERFAWMGRYSGYDKLFEVAQGEVPTQIENVFRTRDSLKEALYAPAAFFSRPHTPFYNGASAASELEVIRRTRQGDIDLVHVAYAENNLRRLAHLKRPQGRPFLVATAHQPPTWWKERHRHPELVSSLDHLIVMSDSQVDYFEPFLPGKVTCIRHGIDTDFFSPKEGLEFEKGTPLRCVFAGTWMRDRRTFRQVVESLTQREPKIFFDLIVRPDQRNDADLKALRKHPRVTWHANLTDGQLLQVYRGALFLLLPLTDCTANNALLEAMACGLPVVSTKVGGIKDYTEESFAELLPAGDVEGLVEATLRFINNPQQTRARGKLARRFCLENLTWEGLAQDTLELYARILSKAPAGVAPRA